MLISDNKKVFLEKQDLLSLSYIKKKAMTIPKMTSLEPSIFQASIFILYT